MRVGGRHLGAVIVAWIAFAPSVEANPSSLPTAGQFVSGFFLSVLVGLIFASRSSRRRWPYLPRLTVPRFLLVYLGVVCVLYATASLTGHWLGSPPWEWTFEGDRMLRRQVPQDGAALVVVACGLGLLAIGARPLWRWRRARSGASLSGQPGGGGRCRSFPPRS